MNKEAGLYAGELRRLLGKVERAVSGLDEAALNWRPPVAEPNSVYVLATHILGNMEGWVLGIACGERIARDRPAEFASSGSDASAIVARAHDLGRRLDEALAPLTAADLDAMRDPTQANWGIGTTQPVSVREAFLHTITHAELHLGHIDMVRELAKAGGVA